MDADEYNDLQNPGGGYNNSQQPGTLYAGTGGTSSAPASGGASTAPPVGTTKSAIHVSVNSASKITLGTFVELLNKTPGIVPEFKNKIKQDKKAHALAVPDYSQNKVVSGKEWLFDLGKAGDGWELTTATLFFGLDAGSYFTMQEDLGKQEERGHPTSDDPDDSLIRPSRDLSNALAAGLMLGLTIPTSAMVAKNPPPPDIVPKPQIARLNSGKGLIIIAREIVVGKRGKVVLEVVPIPKTMIAMTFFHELSAHATFFEQGLDAAHGAPLVDRNFKQAEESYQKILGKEQTALEKKLKTLIDGMNKQVP